MNKLCRIGGVSAMICMIIALASCTISGGNQTPTPVYSSQETASTGLPQDSVTAQTPSAPITELPADYPAGSTLIGELSSQRGTAEIGPFNAKTDEIAVFVRCYGTMSVHVEIPGVASFDQNCVDDSNDRGTMNVFDVRHVGTVTVRGSCDNSNIWAIAVTAFQEAAR